MRQLHLPRPFLNFTVFVVVLFSAVGFFLSQAPTQIFAGEQFKSSKPYSQQVHDADLKEAHKTQNVNRTENIVGNSNDLMWNVAEGMVGSPDPEVQTIIGNSGVSQLGAVMAIMISNPPASAQVWLADAVQNSPFIPKAQAQGIGFKSLSPILPIWKAARDVSYIFFVIAFIVIGFLIMFRQKLGGQTAVTVMSALPNLIITLVLITFSYAIAGLVIDLMYLVIYLVIGVFRGQNLLPSSFVVPGLSGETRTISIEDVALTNNIFYNGLQLVFGSGTSSVTANAAKAVSEMVSTFFNSSGALDAGKVLGIGASIIAYLIFAIAIFFAVTKTFFQLLMSYATFIISVIASPFQLMVGAFTGKQDFWQWLKNLIATLAPFPVVITMIFLAMVLAGQGPPGSKVGYRSGTGGNGFQAPQIGLGNDTGTIAAIQGLIAIGILMLIPEAVKLSRDWIGAKNPFEKYMGDINANLQKGWKGGEFIPGLGLKMPGAKDVIPGLAKSSAGAAALGLTGAGVGGTLGYQKFAGDAKARGAGGTEQFISGSVGALLGGTMGGAGGVLGGAIAPIVIDHGPKIVKGVTKVIDQAVNVVTVAEAAQNFMGGGKPKKTSETGTRENVARGWQNATPTTEPEP